MTAIERALTHTCNADDERHIPCGRPAIATLIVTTEPGDPDSPAVARVHICMGHLMHLLTRHHTDEATVRNAVTVLNAHAISRLHDPGGDTPGRHGRP
jgi:hypothetical protein